MNTNFIRHLSRQAATVLIMGLVMWSPAKAQDTRQAIVLNAAEEAFVMAEMRGFLKSVSGIVDGLASNNMAVISTAAGKSGFASLKGMPPTLKGKLPKAFKILGMDTHKKFDQLGVEARQMGTKGKMLKQLSALLTNCTSCHATFKFTVK